MQSLLGSSFSDNFVSALHGDPRHGHEPRQISEACYSFVKHTAVSHSDLLAYSPPLCLELGLEPLRTSPGADADQLTGNVLVLGMNPHVTCYGGHQFGHWAGQLGDGRAVGKAIKLYCNAF